MKKGLKYSAVVLTPTSARSLQKRLPTKIKSGWRIHCQSMPDNLGHASQEEIDKNKQLNMKATHIGYGEKITAVRVIGTDGLSNTITISVDTETGGKSLDVNTIKIWKELNRPIYLRGELTNLG
jgi:hypothetical protein